MPGKGASTVTVTPRVPAWVGTGDPRECSDASGRCRGHSIVLRCATWGPREQLGAIGSSSGSRGIALGHGEQLTVTGSRSGSQGAALGHGKQLRVTGSSSGSQGAPAPLRDFKVEASVTNFSVGKAFCGEKMNTVS